MRKVAAILVVSTLAPCVSLAVSKEKLVEMVDQGVDASVVLQIVQRDCVDFEVTPDVLIELSPKLPKEILEAAIRCRSAAGAARQDSAAVELSTEPPHSYADVRTVAMVPATLDGIRDEALTSAFIEALKRGKSQWSVLDPLELQIHFEGEGAFHASAPISSLLAAGRAKGADALLLVNGTSYRRLEDPGVRLDVKVVEINQGKVVWSGGDKGVSNFFNMNAAMKNASRNTVKTLP